MTAAEMVEMLQEGIDQLLDGAFEDLVSGRTYADAGVMTRNDGLVLRFRNGDEFQIQVVQSAHGADDDDQGGF